ncbi:LacI family DNA-binding transcriptional regulator [Sagittula salina]|uniref:LacI family DNA-binding transcriptional regulator n=1 Tax=Sagittula salina TaxID=2820268 RepID=A0A940MYF2_9RHOB|nr:LacI family DNA-binding transcriptional regulator [Sagittula salina]MBP0485114.1 LacI family DNA-binding transcriptional regulator [Sagittula salina]
MYDAEKSTPWRGPTISEIAEVAGVGSATVDRVLNNRPGVSEKTRRRVRDAFEKLSVERGAADRPLTFRLYCDSGASFNALMEQAVDRVNRTLPGVQIDGHYVSTNQMDPMPFARKIEDEGVEADGVIVIAREHPAINRAVRKLVGNGHPVVTLTTDLPSSRRLAYVGNDQYAAGSVAAQLIGRALPEKRTNILLMMSVPFRSQQEREMGFRRVLRSEFPHLKIEERVTSDDSTETTREQLAAYIAAHGCPAAIYNLAGANRGVAEALEDRGTTHDTIFVGHELTQYSRALLESGVMDYVISHDFTAEVTSAAEWIRSRLGGTEMSEPAATQISIHTRYNCGP